MPGKILHLPEVEVFKPVSDYTCPDLLWMKDLKVCSLDIPKHVQQTVFDVPASVRDWYYSLFACKDSF